MADLWALAFGKLTIQFRILPVKQTSNQQLIFHFSSPVKFENKINYPN